MSNTEVAIQQAMLKKYDKIIGGTPDRCECLCMLENGFVGLRTLPESDEEFSRYSKKYRANPKIHKWSGNGCTGIRVK